jgi:hypothetical protein
MKQFILFACIVLTTAAMGQKVSNRISFPKGQKLEMIVMSNTVSEGMGNMKVDVTLTRIFDINDVKNGNAEIEHKIKRMQMNIESAVFGNQSFDSEKESDLKKEGFQDLEKSLKNKYSMTVNPSGNVTEVKKDDDNPNTQEKTADNMMDNLLSQVGNGLSVPVPGDRTDFSILPEREVGKGESWTDSSLNRKTVYTIADISENDIMVTFTENIVTQKKQEVMGNEITVNSIENSTGRLTLDRKSGLLKEKSSSSDIEGKMEMMGQSMPINSKTTRSWVIKML